MSTETTEALIERVLAEHTLADLGNLEHRTCVAAAITQALAERERESRPTFFETLRAMDPSPELTAAIDAAERKAR